MKIFLISGKSNSGKEEVARLIKEFYIYKYKKCAITKFGKYIGNFVKELKDWDGNDLTAKVSDFQEVASGIRKVNQDYFVNNMIQDMSIYENFVDNVIVSDCYLPNEIDSFKNVFDDVISINVENQFKASDLTVDEQIDFSEIALENYVGFDYTIINEDLNLLKDKVFKILEEVE